MFQHYLTTVSRTLDSPHIAKTKRRNIFNWNQLTK